MEIVCASHQGLVRLNNEDAVLADAAAGWAILADGMGGLLAGEEASRVAVSAIEQQIGQQNDKQSDDPRSLLINAHLEVQTHAEKKRYLGKMGTTLLVWLWRDGAPVFGHVGDSRLYAVEDQGLVQLTKDQTVAQRMIDEGLIPENEASSAPHQNVLTQALGMPGKIEPETGSTPTAGRLLLCSDGLSDLVQPANMLDQLRGEDLQDCAQQLVRCALDAGGRDNVSVIVVDLDR